MTAPVTAASLVRLEDLRVGDLLAEGGEGQVFQLPRQPHLVLKSYRRPADRSHLEDLVSWPHRLAEAEAGWAGATVRAASAWPCSVVVDGAGTAVGLLMARAPRRFAVRHRDGHSRLASLSYLTSDPEHRAAAYGLDLPPPAGPERVGLVYALARLLAAFETGNTRVAHGDLSTKNVLWSLQRGPEVFVIDCDNSERFDVGGDAIGDERRRRAMTPNWDDPAVPRGANPMATTDRYSLGLVFLRIVGAANFPIQARQRRGEPVEVRFPVPAGPGATVLMDPSASLWDLCARSLSASQPERRPPPAAWLDPLEGLLQAMGAAEMAALVRSAQGASAGEPGGGRSFRGGEAGDEERPAPADVRIIPVAAPPRPRHAGRQGPSGRPATAGGPGGAGRTTTIGYRYGPASATSPAAPTWVRPSGQRAMAPHSVTPAAPILPGMWADFRTQLRRFGSWWLALHRTLVRSSRRGPAGGRRLRALAICLVVDFVIVVLAGAAAALIVSPLIQH